MNLLPVDIVVARVSKAGLEYDPRMLERLVPIGLHAGIRRYVEYGIRPGSGLWAVLTNDLSAAATALDDDNLRHLRGIVRYFSNYVPGRCWGDETKCNNWMLIRGIDGFYPGTLKVEAEVP